MRLNDLSDGSIKTFLILALLAANIAVALAHHRGSSQLPGSGRRGGPGLGDPPKQAFRLGPVEEKVRDRGSPALPEELPR